MTKQQFLEKLKSELKRNNVSDTADIIEEYEYHFTFKIADNYSEEEIAAKLGDPKIIAAQYNTTSRESRFGKVTITVIGLGVSDFLFGILCILLFSWEIVMGALVFSFAALSVCLLGNLGTLEYITMPQMPYHCAFILGLVFISLTALAIVGSIYFYRFICQLIRSYGRFHGNALASASGKAVLPPLSVYPQFSSKLKRNMRTVSLTAVTTFAVFFIIGFIVCAISAGGIEFWHIWRWFE